MWKRFMLREPFKKKTQEFRICAKKGGSRQLLSRTKSFISRDLSTVHIIASTSKIALLARTRWEHHQYATSWELCLPMRLSADFLRCIAGDLAPISGISFIRPVVSVIRTPWSNFKIILLITIFVLAALTSYKQHGATISRFRPLLRVSLRRTSCLYLFHTQNKLRHLPFFWLI